MAIIDLYDETYYELRPKTIGGFYSESEFESYYLEKSILFPNIPKDALRELYFSSWGEYYSTGFISRLNQKKLLFKKDILSLDTLKEVIRHPREGRVDHIANLTASDFCKQFISVPDIQKQWADVGTWKEPIWLFKINNKYFLVEGHTRLGSLYFSSKQGTAKKEHECWVISSDQASYNDFTFANSEKPLPMFPDLINKDVSDDSLLR